MYPATNVSVSLQSVDNEEFSRRAPHTVRNPPRRFWLLEAGSTMSLDRVATYLFVSGHEVVPV